MANIKGKLRGKYKFSIKRELNKNFKTIKQSIKKLEKYYTKIELERLSKLRKLKKKDVRAEALKNAKKIIEVMHENFGSDRILMIKELKKSITQKGIDEKTAKWYASLFKIDVIEKGEDIVFSSKSNFIFKLLDGLNERLQLEGKSLSDIREVEKFLVGMSVDELAEFATFAKEETSREDFFYDIWNNVDDFSNQEIFELLWKFAEEKNISNEIADNFRFFMR